MNPFGIPIDIQHDCPNMVFCHSPMPSESMQWQSWEGAMFVKKNEHLAMKTTWAKVFSVMKLIRCAKIDELSKCLGWSMMVIPGIGDQSHQVEIVFAKTPGALAIPIEQLQMCLTTRMLIVCLSKSIAKGEATKHVCFKMWDSWIWDGFVSNTDHVGIFIDAWTFFSRVFGHSSELRIVIQGRNITPETKFDMITEKNGTIRMHTLLQLQGGGNKSDALIDVKNQLAVFMLGIGADLNETSHMLETMCKIGRAHV